MKTLLCVFTLLCLVGCSDHGHENTVISSSPETESLTPQEGDWVFELDLGEALLPFNFNLTLNNSSAPTASIVNHEEVIEITDIQFRNDSAYFKLPVFDSEFKARIISETELEGVWCNYLKGPDYQIPFSGRWGDKTRFDGVHEHSIDITGKWEVDFSTDDPGAYKAIGNFTSTEEHVFGTFITETGDYRYLDGAMNGNEINLSCFDGSHAFLFKGTLEGDSITGGTFWSGNHWKTNWVAVKNEEFTLRDPYSLTYLVDGYDKLAFSFPDLEGNMVSLSDDKYRDKVTIVQVMGSWCPNCYDESEYYASLYDQYHDLGLEIIALCYEKNATAEEACEVITKLKNHLNCNYDFLFAGKADKAETSASLPMINELISYPTSIVIDRSGKIRAIHTGFYGPGTSDYYTRYTEEFSMLIDKLIREGSL